ncbi:MAG: PulJ/GspJ family protein [Minisyncoccota bacterium]
MKRNLHNQGFTLVEMIVSIGLFTVILFVATSAFLSVVDSDRKTRAIRVVMDNLSISLENIERHIRTGSAYYCGVAGSGVLDCASGGSTLSFTEQDGTTRTTYAWDSETKAIFRTVSAGAPVRITSPEISIDNLKFIVMGSALGAGRGGTDTVQPYVIMAIDGSIGAALASPASRANFKIQTMVTQRNYDN